MNNLQCGTAINDWRDLGLNNASTITSNCMAAWPNYASSQWAYPAYITADSSHRDFTHWLRGFMEGKKSLTASDLKTINERMGAL